MSKKANMILEKLNRNGFESYIVGGAVRDMSIGLTPNDIDITTSATPEEVISLFPKTYPSGIAFGTVTVVIEDEEFEVTTFRTDGKYLDGRRPETVAFGKSIEEDLSRRDFTINAMAMDIDGNITDPFRGLHDIEEKIVRCVGNPEKRFAEDALRMMRAIRFASRYGFAIEENTFNSIKKFAHTIEKVSLERINQEFSKILLSKNPKFGVELLHETGLFDFIFPISFNDIKGNIKNIDKVPANLELRLATMFLELDSEIVEKTLKTLKFTNITIKNVAALVKGYAELNISNNILKVMNIIGKENIFTFLEIIKAIDKEQFKELNMKANEAINQNFATTLKDLAISGNDLMKSTGIKQGKEVGMILNLLLDFVLENPESNNKDILLDLAIKIKNKECWKMLNENNL